MTLLKLDHTLKGSLLQIYPAVLDMRHFGNHHPYIKEVKLLETTPAYSEYSIKEFIWLFGFIPQWPNYNARVFEKEKLRHILYTSNVKGGIYLEIDFHFSHNNGTTVLGETIRVSGNRLLAAILLGAIRKAHPLLFKSLERSL